MWVLPADHAKTPLVALPRGRYLLPWYLTEGEIARTVDLLAALLEGVAHHALVPRAALGVLTRAPIPDADRSLLAVRIPEGVPAAEAEEELARIACRYLLVQWPSPREHGY